MRAFEEESLPASPGNGALSLRVCQRERERQKENQF